MNDTYFFTNDSSSSSFEQFCINLCNEKLQQLFIQLTLRLEQEEYLAEGIDWVQITFDDNKEICDMIEEKPLGITAILDEECLLGKSTDLSFLAKINEKWQGGKYFYSHESSDIQTQKIMERDEFRLVHYAGEVKYCVKTFLEKNVDTLYRDLVEVMTKTTNSITNTVFRESEVHDKKRPDTTIAKFQRSLNELMYNLKNKQPSYIRCIRPNDTKSAGVFDDKSVRHQVKYLGLMENLRIRRAGFAYRRPYHEFLERYKYLSKKTWPNKFTVRGKDGGNDREKAKEGVQVLVKDLGYTEDDYKMGKTKIFIRSPVTLFKTEDAFQAAKHRIAADIQKIWKGRKQRKEFLKIREAAISMERIVRGFLARREALKRRNAIETIRKFVTGFLTRNGPITDLNLKFLGLARAEWLKRLAQNLPKSVLDTAWPVCPVACAEASVMIQNLHRKHLARKYCLALTAERKYAINLKICAETLFKGKKESYPDSFASWFKTDRVSEEHKNAVDSFKAQINGEEIKYEASVKKWDRHEPRKERPRVLLITDKSIWLVDPKSGKRKHRLPHQSIVGLTVTGKKDSSLFIQIPNDLKKDKGDLILVVPHLIEAVTIFTNVSKMKHNLTIKNDGEITHHIINGKDGKVQIVSGSVPKVFKNKEGKLIIEG